MSELRALTVPAGSPPGGDDIRGSIAGLPPAVEQMFAKGYLAVDFFFLLSGFVIWLTWIRGSTPQDTGRHPALLAEAGRADLPAARADARLRARAGDRAGGQRSRRSRVSPSPNCRCTCC
ncbi:hypothetical protein AB5I41_11800 [Sphingomonas sp. MMS24-JH45]